MSTFTPALPGWLASASLRSVGVAGWSPRRMTTREASEESIENRSDIDGQLVQRIAKGDRAAFSQLYDRFSRPLYATAVRVLNDAKEAEDIVQDVFLALWEKAGAFDSERGSAFSWAITLTRNRAIDRVRMRKRRSELLAASSPDDLAYGVNGTAPDSAEDLSLKEKGAAVRTAVATLPAEQQRALELAFFSGLTQQEIAEKLHEPLGTVKARIRRGLLKLREVLSLRP